MKYVWFERSLYKKMRRRCRVMMLSLCGAWWQIAGCVRGRYSLPSLIQNDGSSCIILNVL